MKDVGTRDVGTCDDTALILYSLDDDVTLEVCVLLKRKKQKARPEGGKPKGTLESESRNAIL